MTGWRRGYPVPADAALWDDVAKTITPLRPRRSPAHAVKQPPAVDMMEDLLAADTPVAPKAGHPAATPAARPLQRQKPAHGAGPLQKDLKRKLGRGTEQVAERLDLHGLRQEDAHRQLLAFLRGAQARGSRIVLVITGKGQAGDAHGTDRGVLRRSVPLWLRLPEFRELVAGYDAAHLHHGGMGALYVHVRRRREGAGR